MIPDHPENGGKAAFSARFGYAPAEADAFAAALLAHPLRNDVFAVKATSWSQSMAVRCRLDTPDDRNPCIVTVWMVIDGAPPRLVTVFPG